MTRTHGLILPVLACVASACAQPVSVEERISGRSFPSVFQAWNPADNLPGEDRLTTLARHDLVFHSPEFFGLRWNRKLVGLADGFEPESVAGALRMRRALLDRNPHMIFLAEIRYRDAPRRYLPAEHPWWKRGKDGTIESGWDEGGFLKLDFADPEYQKHVAAQARAAMDSRVFDGIMLDWWQDDDARLALVRRIRDAIGDRALIMANANDRKTPNTAPYLNGYFMECYRSRTAADWERIADTLAWAESRLRAPRINCLETWYHVARTDLNLMRATTTLSLTLSDGYALFSDPNPLPSPDHLHNWYSFWGKTLGRALARGAKQEDGTIRREFERGTAIYNPPGNPVRRVSFSEPRKSAATGVVATEHSVAPGDGDILSK